MGTNGFVFQGLQYASMSLAILYFILSIVILRKLKILHQGSPDLNTRKLFVMSCLLSAILRTLSFTTMTVFAFFGYNISYDGESTSNSVIFFEKALLVLFDFPDFCFISAYILLILAWAESYLLSRKHWLSSIAFRRVWLLAYLILNIFLYGSQVGIYSLLFIPKIDQTILSSFIYITLAIFNLFMPVLWIAIYGYLIYKFAGFPYASYDAKERMMKLSLLASVWTATRLFYGIVALTSVIQDFFFEIKRSKVYYSMMLIIIFTICEIFPIIFSLRSNLISSFSGKKSPEDLKTDDDRNNSLSRTDTNNSDMNLDSYEEDTNSNNNSPIHQHSVLQTPLLATPQGPRAPISRPAHDNNINSSNINSNNSRLGSIDSDARTYSNDSLASSMSSTDDDGLTPSNTPLKSTKGMGAFTVGGRASGGLINKWIGF